MKYNCSLSTHIVKVRELVSGFKVTIDECDYNDIETTVANLKETYLSLFQRELPGDDVREWISIPNRGHGWTFLNEIRYHPGCKYVEFKFGADSPPSHGRRWVKHAVI